MEHGITQLKDAYFMNEYFQLKEMPKDYWE